MKSEDKIKMDPNTSKKKKNNVDDKEEDMLSKLPDDILTGILSHLTGFLSHLNMKEVVRSGILSKRWKSVWLSVPTLDLDQYDFTSRGKCRTDDDSRARFSNFVNETLIARKLPCLENIRLRSFNVDPYLVQSWIQAALMRDVSKLDVFFSARFGKRGMRDSPCELTPNLFSYNKLVVLKLHGCFAPSFLETSSCFPSLKELELDDIHYQDCDSLPNLLSNCPILENLNIKRSEWDRRLGNTGKLIIKSRSLKVLTVLCRVGSRDVRNDEFKMVIDAPAVENLYVLEMEARRFYLDC